MGEKGEEKKNLVIKTVVKDERDDGRVSCAIKIGQQLLPSQQLYNLPSSAASGAVQ